MDSISVVIPCYNEERNIENTIMETYEILNSMNLNSYEIVVVNDYSQDSTLNILENIKLPNLIILNNERNMGKGFSVKKGILTSNSEYICFTDADSSTPVFEIKNAYTYMKNKDVDIIIGSRRLLTSQVVKDQTFLRKIMGKVFSIIRNLIVPLNGIIDSQCGFKFFKKHVAHTIFKKQTMNRFIFDVEILYIANLMNFKINEIPVMWINDEYSSVNPIRDSMLMFFNLVKIRLNKSNYIEKVNL